MNSIHEMWMEYLKNTYSDLVDPANTMPREVYTVLRKAFYAGFNRCYNIMNVGTMNSNDQWESEMDDASDGKFNTTGGVGSNSGDTSGKPGSVEPPS